MKLCEFRGTHFRCLYDPGWITIHDLTVLIGCNDGGKTATIEALDCFFGNILPAPDAYSYVPDAPLEPGSDRSCETEITLEAKFALNSQEVELVREVLLVPSTEYVHIRKVFRSDETSPVFEMLTHIPLDPKLPTAPHLLKMQEVRELLKEYNIPSPGGTALAPLLEVLTRWLRQQPTKEDWAPVPPQVEGILPLYQVVIGEDPEDTILRMLTVEYRQLLKQQETLELLQEFQTKVDKQLRAPLEAKTASLAQYVSKYLPYIKYAYVNPIFDVSAKLQSAPLTLVGSDGNRIDLSARGAGTRQQVTLAVFEWNSETIQPSGAEEGSDTIIAFDEPDLHLDYEAQRRIYEAIESYVAKGVQVIVATHSINFINRVPIQSIYHLAKPANKSETNIECLSPSTDDPDEQRFFIDKLGEAMGLDNASILYERCFFAFEGPTEQAALPKLFELHTNGDSLIRRGIKLVNCYDSYGAIVFAKFIHRNGRHVLFMVDEDTTLNKGTKRLLTTSALERAGFSIQEQVNFVEPECFEYAFSDEVWSRVLNQNQPGSKSDWTPDKVQTYRLGAKKFLDSMREILQEESKPEIGIMLARAVESKAEIPLGIRNCFDSAIRLANQQ